LVGWLVDLSGALLPGWLSDTDWRKRHAALICLAQIAEGCSKLMLEQVEPLVQMCLQGLRDPHAKVTAAAAVGMCTHDCGCSSLLYPLRHCCHYIVGQCTCC
jgi:hypothetical protein